MTRSDGVNQLQGRLPWLKHRVSRPRPDLPVKGLSPDDEQTLRDEIQYTREEVEATVDELAGRARAAARSAVKPLIIASVLVLGVIGVVLVVRKWRR